MSSLFGSFANLFFIPKEFIKQNIAVFVKFHTLLFKELTLHTSSAESKGGGGSSFAINNAKAGYRFGRRIDVQSITDNARHPRITAYSCDLSVGCNLSVWDSFYCFVYLVKSIHHSLFFEIFGHKCMCPNILFYSTVTDFARFLGLSTSQPRITEV